MLRAAVQQTLFGAALALVIMYPAAGHEFWLEPGKGRGW